jgi:hypothetical protein
VGSRDRLLTEVLWRMAQRSIERAQARRTRDGIEGVIQVVRLFARQVLASRSLRRFIAAEPQTATRLLTSADGGVQRQAIEATTRLFKEVGLTGHAFPIDGVLAQPRLADDPDRVAYLLVRIVESVCFAELAGTRPDLELIEQTIRAMLVRACTPRRSRVTRFMDAAMCLALTWVPDALFSESRLPLALA